MHSDNTVSRHCAIQTPSCHLCPQRAIARPQHKPNGSCLLVESGVAHRTASLPFPEELRIADYRPERTRGTSLPHQVYTEQARHPCYSWGDVRSTGWDWPLNSPHAPCMGVREIRRECGCVQRWYYPEHPFNGSHGPPHLKVKGQQYYREVLYVSEQHFRGHEQRDADLQEPQWDNVHTPAYNGHFQRRRVAFQNHEERHGLSSPETGRQCSPNKTHCNGTNSGHAAFFPTEVPQSKLGRSRRCSPTLKVNELGQEIRASQGAKSLENQGNRRKKQGTVREQIKQVVTELEEVLGGLKQVQLEMKEVVQQIDVLTSNIDLGEEEPRGTSNLLQDGSHQSSQTDVFALTHSSSGDQEVSPKAQSDTTPETSYSSTAQSPITVDTVHPPVVRNHTRFSPPGLRSVAAENNCNTANQSYEHHRINSTANGSCLPHRTSKVKANGPQHLKEKLEHNNKTHRPPPYPQNGLVKMQAPAYPGKHKTISSTIV